MSKTKAAKKAPAEPKPVVELLGHDGNAMLILAKCSKAARRAGWTPERIESFMNEAKSGDYDNLLTVAQNHFEIQ